MLAMTSLWCRNLEATKLYQSTHVVSTILPAAGSSGSGCNTSDSAIQVMISSAKPCISAVTASFVDAKLPFKAVPKLVMPLAKSLKFWLACNIKETCVSDPFIVKPADFAEAQQATLHTLILMPTMP